jgi:predicted transcriptional regulator
VESRIAFELLRLGQSKIGEIIRRVGLHRGTVYNALRALTEKGFVSETHLNGIYLYALIPQRFRHYIQAEQYRLAQLEERLGELNVLAKLHTKKEPHVEVFVGDSSFWAFFNDLYDWAKRHNKEYLFLGRGQEMIEHFGVEMYRSTQELKSKLKVQCRVILNEVARGEAVSKIVEGEVRYIPWEYTSPVSTWLYNQKVVIVLWEAKPLISIVVNSVEAYRSYFSFFQALWSTASP